VIRAEFETDAQLLAMALSSWKPDYSTEPAIIEDLKIQSRMWFSSCCIRFAKRETNTVAHILAQLGAKCDVKSSLSWDYEVPACTVDAVKDDIALNVL
jgi:hypothetical protein